MAPRSERSLQASVAVLTSWSNTTDPQARTKPGRDAFLSRFEREVDPEGTLSPEERSRRADYARRAHFKRMALRSAQVRRAKAAGKTASTPVGTEAEAVAS